MKTCQSQKGPVRIVACGSAGDSSAGGPNLGNQPVPKREILQRFKYYFEGREKLLSLGTYPDVTLRRARERRDEVRKIVSDGVDPSAERQAKKAALADSFEAVAREWLTTHAGGNEEPGRHH